MRLRGDALAAESVEESMRYLALVMSFASHITDPEVFIIGVRRIQSRLLSDRHAEALICRIYLYTEPCAKVVLASLGNDAGMCGAARLVL